MCTHTHEKNIQNILPNQVNASFINFSTNNEIAGENVFLAFCSQSFRQMMVSSSWRKHYGVENNAKITPDPRMRSRM